MAIKMGRRAHTAAAAGACAALLALAGCGSSAEKDPEPAAASTGTTSGTATTAAELQPFTFASPIPDDVSLTPWYVASDVFAKRNGLAVRFVYSNGDPGEGYKLLLTGRADAFAQQPDITAAAAGNAGLPVKYFRDDFQHQIFGFAVRADSPIRSIRELDGKVVAIGQASWQVAFDPLAAAAEVKPQFKVTGITGRWPALAGSRVDAVATWDTDALNPSFQRIVDVRFLPAREELPAIAGQWSNGDIALAERIADGDAKLVAWGKSISQAQVFMRANPACAARVLARHVKGLDEAQLLRAVRVVDALMQSPYTDEHGLGAVNEEAFQRQLDGLHAGGLLRRQLKAGDLVDQSLLSQIDDFDRDAVVAEAKACALD
jgi:NitT/TauT family transport system substrate-binding protein